MSVTKKLPVYSCSPCAATPELQGSHWALPGRKAQHSFQHTVAPILTVKSMNKPRLIEPPCAAMDLVYCKAVFNLATMRGNFSSRFSLCCFPLVGILSGESGGLLGPERLRLAQAFSPSIVTTKIGIRIRNSVWQAGARWATCLRLLYLEQHPNQGLRYNSTRPHHPLSLH